MEVSKEELKKKKKEERRAAKLAKRQEEEHKLLYNKDGTKKTKKQRIKSEIIGWGISILIAGALACIIHFFMFMKAGVVSGSMLDTLQVGDVYIGNRMSYWFSGPDRGDIIFFDYPDDETQVFVKRVIGLPGETLEIKDGLVYINGCETPLDEPYLREEPKKQDYGPIEIPEGCYFVMGDNRNHSHDSRGWNNTFVTEDKILAKAFFRLWPPIKFAEHYDYEVKIDG